MVLLDSGKHNSLRINICLVVERHKGATWPSLISLRSTSFRVWGILSIFCADPRRNWLGCSKVKPWVFMEGLKVIKNKRSALTLLELAAWAGPGSREGRWPLSRVFLGWNHSAGAFPIPQNPWGGQKQPRNEVSSQREQSRSGACAKGAPAWHRDPGALGGEGRAWSWCELCQAEPVTVRQTLPEGKGSPAVPHPTAREGKCDNIKIFSTVTTLYPCVIQGNSVSKIHLLSLHPAHGWCPQRISLGSSTPAFLFTTLPMPGSSHLTSKKKQISCWIDSIH